MNKAILALVVVFLGFWLFTDPDGMAHDTRSAAHWAWGGTQQGFQSIIDYLDAL